MTLYISIQASTIMDVNCLILPPNLCHNTSYLAPKAHTQYGINIEILCLNVVSRASHVAKGYRICLPMQEM